MSSTGGPEFEREMCKLLSSWWTNGLRDDIFWRSQSSGGRATTRRKRGRSTKGHEGDVCASDPLGQPLIKLFAIELKKGYARYTALDLLDQLPTSKVQTFEKWIKQAKDAMEASSARWWLIINRRPKREACVYMPLNAWDVLDRLSGGNQKVLPLLSMNYGYGSGSGVERLRMVGMRLKNFLHVIKPAVVIEAANSYDPQR